jgi:hypothetical protein
MTQRRWLSIVCALAGAVLAAQPAQAQLSLPPAGPSGGGFAGANSGGYGASVPLDIPAAHGGLPVPVQITYSEHGVGAAGRGWDVPLSYIRRDTTVIHRRPVGTANVTPAPREQVSLVLSGRATDLIFAGTVNTTTGTDSTWIARNDDVALQVRRQHPNNGQPNDDTWVAYDGQGRTYTFVATAISPALAGTGIWLLQDITAIGGGKVHLEYVIGTPTVSGNAAISIDLTRVSYNPSPGNANCFKNGVQLNYDQAADPPVSISLIGTKLLVRQHTLRDPTKPAPDPNNPTTSAVDILATDSCPAGGAPPTYVRLRHYEFAYAADGDTGQTRLQEVRIFGRDGTAEANASSSIPLAKYSYGTAITGGQLNYGSTVPVDSASSFSLSNLVLMQPTSPVLQGFGNGVGTILQLVDVTGDGRPDLVTFGSGQLNVRPSYSTAAAYGFGPSRALSDSTLSPRQPVTQTTQSHLPPDASVSHNRVWRRAMDVNGDGRIDIIDAAEQSGHWVVYLNTPDAADPTIVHWQRRSFPTANLAAQLAARGMTESGFVPLSRTAIASRGQWGKCWQWISADQSWEDVTGILDCGGSTSLLTVDDEYLEWDIRDINGDGYPDVVFNSSQVVASKRRTVDTTPQKPTPNALAYTVDDYSVGLVGGSNNAIDAMFNVMGTRLINGESDVFSTAVRIVNHDACGVERWAGDSNTARHMECGIADVNGDGVVDRISGLSVFLGIGAVDGSGFFTASAMMSLPGPLANETNSIIAVCKGGGTSFASEHKARLIDLTGDGIPDYVTATGSGTGWGIFVGTGAGFTGSMPITAGFALGVNTESCNSTVAGTSAGLADIDGDGRPELLNAQHQLLSITGSDGLAGAPSAGRLIGVDNEFGAKTNVHYRSIKGDTTATHQVPYAEIVVDSVDASNTNGSRIGATFYAYGGAELFFEPARDSFIFPGYRRTITLQTPQGQLAGVGAFVVSDSYAPVSAVDPYGISGGATIDPDQRYALFRRIGRPRDVTVLSGNVGTAALSDPRQLLGIDVASDLRRIAAAHYDWSARRLSSSSDPNGPEGACTEVIYPYDYQGSQDYANAPHPTYDPCKAHGFAYSSSVQSWRGDPGGGPPQTANVQTRADVLAVDDFGRATSAKRSAENDLCMDTAFAQPTQSSYPRVLTAVGSRTVSDCSTHVILAKDTYGYDGSTAGSVAAGSVSLGHMTSHDVERHDDTGTLLNSIHQFDITWNASGNPSAVTTTRDGASRTVTVHYDLFELAMIDLTVTATGLPATTETIDRDPLTLNATSTTDPNGTKRGARFDGFDRETMSTITPPGGTEGALWFNRYNLSSGTRNIRHTDFQTAVAPGTAGSAAGRTTITYLDGLGRATATLFGLGADFPNQAIATSRVFDTLGRVAFESDPYPSTQSSTTAYGTTYFFNPDGTLQCSVRGSGPQTKIPGTVDANHVVHPSTDETNELYPTCIQRSFQSNTEVVTLRDASSYLTGSPQEGVAKTSYVTATGRVIKRSTLGKDGTQLEYATLDYDRLGQLTSMTRFQNASGGTNPVASSWHYDSLGQLLSLQEPDSALQTNTYSNWGELVDSGRGTLHTVATYDALGRVVHREDQRGGVTDAATVNDYHYDNGVNVTTLVTATYTLGRLTQASWPTGLGLAQL